MQRGVTPRRAKDTGAPNTSGCRLPSIDQRRQLVRSVWRNRDGPRFDRCTLREGWLRSMASAVLPTRAEMIMTLAQ